MSNITKIPPSAERTHAIHLALGKHQERVDQAYVVADLLLRRFNDAVHGDDGPEDGQVISALQLIVEKLGEVCSLADDVQLQHEGTKILGARNG